MYRIEKLETFVPGLEQLLFAYSAHEFFSIDANEVLKKSEKAWSVYVDDLLLCHAGIVRPTFLSRPQFWFLATNNIKKVSKRVFIELSKRLREEMPGSVTLIEDNYVLGHRFAAFCGFKPMPNLCIVENKTYQLYEVG